MSDEFEFARLVYQLVVVEKIKTIKELSDELGLGYAAVHARLSQRTPFRPHEVRALLEAIPDPRLAMYFLEKTPLLIAKRVEPGERMEDPWALAHEALVRLVPILNQTREMLADGRLDHREREILGSAIETVEINLATLRTMVLVHES